MLNLLLLAAGPTLAELPLTGLSFKRRHGRAGRVTQRNSAGGIAKPGGRPDETLRLFAELQQSLYQEAA